MLIFLDVETTGLEDKDKVCSVGVIAVLEDEIISKYELINEGKKISSKASSVNHITNEMLKDKPKLVDSDIFSFLQKYNNSDTTVVGHNINFDLLKLMACGFDFKGQIIDTLRVTKHLITECESYALQFLRYDFKLYKEEMKSSMACGIKAKYLAHNALNDALIVKILYEYLLDLSTQEKMKELTFKNVLIEKFIYGKYAGHYIEEIAINDVNYLQWMLHNIVDLDEDLRYSINYYLEG